MKDVPGDNNKKSKEYSQAGNAIEGGFYDSVFGQPVAI